MEAFTKLTESVNREQLRTEMIGGDVLFGGPYGKRKITYADFTATGKPLRFFEQWLLDLKMMCANTHTEDNRTGVYTSALYHEAKQIIRKAFGANDSHKLICRGSGASGAIRRFQQIIGVAIPPATIKLLGTSLSALKERMGDDLPVVFVGPYEHHSNEVSWRECLCEVVSVSLGADGGIDYAALELQLQSELYAGRPKYGSFSAASNVTGRLTDIRRLTRLLNSYDVVVCFDCAAVAPYRKINMSPGHPLEEIDVVFVSMHKFIGGPEATGVLIFHERLYSSDLAPVNAAGGTVEFVNDQAHDFHSDIEMREDGGTPAIYQTVRAAGALLIRDAIGTNIIHEIEERYCTQMLERFADVPEIEVLGSSDPRLRLPIVSFLVRDVASGLLIHPKFVTVLLDHLTGVQARAGCSCAGPYGHYLLDVNSQQSEQYRRAIAQGFHGVKPGWTRVGCHYSMRQQDVDYLVEMIVLVAQYARYFMSDYRFDARTGEWAHRSYDLCHGCHDRGDMTHMVDKEVSEMFLRRDAGLIRDACVQRKRRSITNRDPVELRDVCAAKLQYFLLFQDNLF